LILRNRIFGQDNGLGIELVNGGNNDQAFPAITSAIFDGTFTTITGTLASAANATYTVELFINSVPNPSGYGEGERFFASLTVATDANGHAAFSLSLPVVVDPGQFVSATATDPGGNTSAFALCVEVTGPGAPSPSLVAPLGAPAQMPQRGDSVLSEGSARTAPFSEVRGLGAEMGDQIPRQLSCGERVALMASVISDSDASLDASVFVLRQPETPV